MTDGAGVAALTGDEESSDRHVLDCDVHIDIGSLDSLRPYLNGYWNAYLDDTSAELGGNSYPRSARTTGNAEAQTADEISDVLDREHATSAILTCPLLDRLHRNPPFTTAVANAANAWTREQFLDCDGRFRGSVLVSTFDLGAAVEEIDRRADDPRWAHVLLPLRTETPYGSPQFRPLFEAAARCNIPIALHAWGRDGSAPTPSGFTTTYIEDYVSNSHIAPLQLTSLIMGGAFASCPGLKVIFLECGFTWLPTYLWRLDKDWKGVWREVPWVKELPSEYVRRHMRFSIAPAQLPADGAAIDTILEMVGPELLVYSSDFPHDHGDSPGRMLARLDANAARAVRRDNALEFYGGRAT